MVHCASERQNMTAFKGKLAHNYLVTFLFEIITFSCLMAQLMPIRKRTIETCFEKP